MGEVTIRGLAGRLVIIGVGDLVAGVFIIVAVNAQQLPVAPVRGIVVMVVVFMVHREFAQTLAAELATTTAANPWEKFEGALPITGFPFFPDTPRLRNTPFDIAISI